MSEIQKNTEIPKNIENNFEAKSVTIERLSEICMLAWLKEAEKQCKITNNLYSEEFEKKGLDFFAALNSKVENPIV